MNMSTLPPHLETNGLLKSVGINASPLTGVSATSSTWVCRLACFVMIAALTIALFIIAFIYVIRRLGKPYLKAVPSSRTPWIPTPAERQEHIADLDDLFAHRDLLRSSWAKGKDSQQGMVVLLTGVTGYVGRAVLYQLLRLAKEESSTAVNKPPRLKIFVMVRSKRNVSVEDRIESLRTQPMFSDLQEQWKEISEIVETGDMTLVDCGIAKDTVQKLSQSNVTHIVHCAGDVTFDQPLNLLAAANITASLQLQSMANKWSTFQRMVYVSTAFVNPTCGDESTPNPESLVEMNGVDPFEVYQSMMGDQKFANTVKEGMGFQNNYVFSKCISEHLLSRDEAKQLWIARPAVVGPSWVLPAPGWNGDSPSTITALGLILRVGGIRFTGAVDHPAPLVPVDTVAAGVIYAMVGPTKSCSETDKPSLNILNLTWSHLSEKKFLSFLEFIKQAIRYWVIKGHWSDTSGCLSLFLESFVVGKSVLIKTLLHRLINCAPIQLLLAAELLLSTLGISILDVKKKKMAKKLLKATKVIQLYQPFFGRHFFFEGSMHVPPSLNLNQYVYSNVMAVETFITAASRNRK